MERLASLAGAAERAEDMRRERLRRSDLYWVTGPMLELALDASRDIPGVTAQDRPSLDGILGCEVPLPPLVLSERVPAVPVDALHWRTMPDGHLEVTLLARPSSIPSRWQQLVSDFRYVAPIPGAEIGGDLPFLTGEDSPPGVESLMCFVAACWTMMMTPTVAQRRVLDSCTGQPAQRQTPQTSTVTVIDLRPLRHVEVEQEEASGRRLTVRHLVRGHWTQQAHGPGRLLRRLQWVAPYIKGPSGAPLKTSTARVMVWRRA